MATKSKTSSSKKRTRVQKPRVGRAISVKVDLETRTNTSPRKKIELVKEGKLVEATGYNWDSYYGRNYSALCTKIKFDPETLKTAIDTLGKKLVVKAEDGTDIPAELLNVGTELKVPIKSPSGYSHILVSEGNNKAKIDLAVHSSSGGRYSEADFSFHKEDVINALELATEKVTVKVGDDA